VREQLPSRHQRSERRLQLAVNDEQEAVSKADGVAKLGENLREPRVCAGAFVKQIFIGLVRSRPGSLRRAVRPVPRTLHHRSGIGLGAAGDVLERHVGLLALYLKADVSPQSSDRYLVVVVG
jgi:hypothetical protein